MKVRERRDDLTRRVGLLIASVQILVAVVLAGFWVTQIARGSEYRALAENNRLRQQSIKAPRGLIYDRTGIALVENTPSYDLFLDRSRSPDLDASLAFAALTLDRPIDTLQARLEASRGIASFKPILLAEDLTLPQVTRFGVFRLEHPEFEVEVGQLRLYRQGEETAHLLGYLGEASGEDLQRLPQLYSVGDLVGRKGVERVYDQLLRGRVGERVQVVDSRGKPLEEFERKPAIPGRDLRLTLDLELQREARRLLGDRVGAVVALDPRDGAVRALVSSPSFNPNLFARRLDGESWQALLSAPHQPLQDRTLQSTYSPGSLFKIVMGVAGLAEGATTVDEKVFCGGAVKLYNRRFRCWKQAGHGWVNLSDSIKYSCDIFFYQLGQKLGIERIADYARRFGLGRPTGIDLNSERAGLVPDRQWSVEERNEPWYPGDTISVSIGQGALLTTPLQMATLVAATANGGHLVTPHLVRRGQTPPPPRLNIDRSALKVVQEGLLRVVNERGGTGGQARVPGLLVAGKTGTVQVVTQKTWIDSSTLPFEKRDHAWFGSYAPADDPRLVVVVFVEHGGKGSEQAAPVARGLYEHFFQADHDGRRSLGP